jgi:hypothetical protein
MRRFRAGGRRATAFAAAAATAAFLWGCTSDEANPVGATVPGEISLNPPITDVFTGYARSGVVAVVNQARHFDKSEVLYLGRQDGEASSILARYDFSTLPDSLFAGAVIDDQTITDVRLRLFRTLAYAEPDTVYEDAPAPLLPVNPLKRFRVYSLAEPFDVAAYPGPEPATGALLATLEDQGNTIFIDLPVGSFLDWYENGQDGLLIGEGDGSEPGLIGYASVDMSRLGYNEIDRVGAGTAVGPTITVGYATTANPAFADTSFVFKPTADVSTFHVLNPAIEDFGENIEVQTHLRRMPWFFPDLSALPDGVLINRAVLRLSVAEGTFGINESFSLHEVPLSLLADRDTVTLAELDENSLTITGQTNVDLAALLAGDSQWIGFDVTSTVQRWANGVFDEETVFLLTASEKFAGYTTSGSYDAGFYLGRYLFAGSDDAALRPHFEITYTLFSGGGS